jgi:hypothetical protein
LRADDPDLAVCDLDALGKRAEMIAAIAAAVDLILILILIPARGGAGPHSGPVAAARFADAVDCCLPPHDGQSHFHGRRGLHALPEPAGSLGVRDARGNG